MRLGRQSECRVTVIHLGHGLLHVSSDLPEDIGRADRAILLFGLAPDGVYLACRVTTAAGGLLPHLFTLTRHSMQLPKLVVISTRVLIVALSAGRSISVALSRGHPRWTLSSVLPCGARTFLPACTARRQSVQLRKSMYALSCMQGLCAVSSCRRRHACTTFSIISSLFPWLLPGGRSGLPNKSAGDNWGS